MVDEPPCGEPLAGAVEGAEDAAPPDEDAGEGVGAQGKSLGDPAPTLLMDIVRVLLG